MNNIVLLTKINNEKTSTTINIIIIITVTITIHIYVFNLPQFLKHAAAYRKRKDLAYY